MRRNRREMKLDTLSVIHSGVNKPTRIMYKTNLSWQTLHEILDYLLERKLITTSKIPTMIPIPEGKKRYYITPTGRKALIHNQHVSDALN